MNEIDVLKSVVSNMNKVNGADVRFYPGSDQDINEYLSASDNNKYPLIYLITPYTLGDGVINSGKMVFIIAVNNRSTSMPNTNRASLTLPILLNIYEDFKKQLKFNSYISLEFENITRTTYFGYKINSNEKNSYKYASSEKHSVIDIWDALRVEIKDIKFNFNQNCIKNE